MIHWSEDRRFVEKEFIRMGFDKDSRWRISDINKNFELCNTYPRFLILPSSFKDEDLESVAKFRYFRRIPTAAWRHIKNGCFILRSSQPTVGWFGWFRSDLDESLVQSYVNNTMPPNSESNEHDKNNLDESVETGNDINKRAVIDAATAKDDGNDLEKTTPQHTNYLPQQLLDQELKDQSNNNNNFRDNASRVLISGNGKMTTEADQTPTKTINTSSPTETSLNSHIRLEASEKRRDSNEELLDTDYETTSPVQSNLDTSSSTTNGNGNGNGISIVDNIISPLAGNITTATIQTSKMLIIDARSYTAAMANRAKGGGCECSEYYQRCEVQFMNLANIHSIRKSFLSIRSVCEAYSEQSNK